VAVVLGFVALGSLMVRHVSARVTERTLEPDGAFAVWGRLSFLQILGFTAMEVTERGIAHVPVAHMFHHEVFAVGLAVQVAVALAAALVLRWLSGTVERFVLAVRRSPRLRPPSILTRPASVRAPVKSPLTGAAGLRGPPSIVRI
jgi:hypothetical protein